MTSKQRHESALLVGVDEGQEMLNVSRTTIYKLMDSGELPSVRLGTRRLIVRSAITDLIERAVVQPRTTNEAPAI